MTTTEQLARHQSTGPGGTPGGLPWTNRPNLKVAWEPNFAPGLMVKMDVFNIFNNQKVTSVSEVAEDSATGAPLNTYLLPRSYQEPRSFRFTVQYEFAAPVAAPEPVAPPPAKTCVDLDDDADGVNNCDDKCPGSTAGSAVGADGCPVPPPEPAMEPKPFRG